MLKGTVLVIDDDEGILVLVQAALNRVNYHTLISTNGRDGISLAQSTVPDLIILDDAMPQMSGGEVCRELRSHPLTSHIPIIICSASLETSNPNYARNLGADSVLVKPFRPRDVVELVSRLAQR